MKPVRPPFRATGTGAMSTTITPGTKFELESVRLHVVSGPGGSGNFTATVDSAAGANYDYNLITEDMTSASDVGRSYSPGESSFAVGDSLVFAWANAGGKTWGLEVHLREVE